MSICGSGWMRLETHQVPLAIGQGHAAATTRRTRRPTWRGKASAMARLKKQSWGLADASRTACSITRESG